MAGSNFYKFLWLGRATSAVVGLAVILVLMLGVATAALAQGGDYETEGEL